STKGQDAASGQCEYFSPIRVHPTTDAVEVHRAAWGGRSRAHRNGCAVEWSVDARGPVKADAQVRGSGTTRHGARAAATDRAAHPLAAARAIDDLGGDDRGHQSVFTERLEPVTWSVVLVTLNVHASESNEASVTTENVIDWTAPPPPRSTTAHLSPVPVSSRGSARRRLNRWSERRYCHPRARRSRASGRRR